MCGIAGFTNFKQRVADPEAVIRAMTATLAPRGPDGEGYHTQGVVALGHRRLSIIDIEGGAQPFAADGGRYQFVYNGELYNFIELRKALESRGCTFETRSDTEVLLRQMIVDDVDGLRALNGMFAFGLWDVSRRRMILARDPVGIKPLYYAVVGGDLVFASEMKALLRHPAIARDLEMASVSKYLTYGYVPAPATIFRGVHKLEPGSYLVFDESGLRKGTYWDIPLEDRPLSGRRVDECADELLELLRDSVTKQLRSDVPVGVFLSGGIDSSTVTALAAQASSSRIRSFSIGFEESSYDESPYAREVAALYNTEHHHETLSARRALDMLPQVMGILDEPLGDASILPTYLLSNMTAQHVKVVLGGDGGDELFAGYPAFQAHLLMEKLTILPTTWRDRLNRFAKLMPVSHRYASVDFLVQQFFKGAGVSPEIRFFLWLGPFGNEQKRQILTPAVQQQLLRMNPFEDIINYVRQSQLVRDFERILYLCMKLYLQDGILVKVDRASMANSLEVRVPLLDHNLVEYTAGIPNVYKLHGLTTKYILKRAVRNLLPARIIKRRKAGFMIPLAQWLSKDLKPMLDDYCSPEALARDGLFQPEAVQAMLKEHQNCVRDHRKAIWALLAFQIWRRNYGPS